MAEDGPAVFATFIAPEHQMREPEQQIEPQREPGPPLPPPERHHPDQPAEQPSATVASASVRYSSASPTGGATATTIPEPENPDPDHGQADPADPHHHGLLAHPAKSTPPKPPRRRLRNPRGSARPDDVSTVRRWPLRTVRGARGGLDGRKVATLVPSARPCCGGTRRPASDRPARPGKPTCRCTRCPPAIHGCDEQGQVRSRRPGRNLGGGDGATVPPGLTGLPLIDHAPSKVKENRPCKA
jgi:hypothetical protein